MKVGDIVKWNGVSRTVQGMLTEDLGNGDWYARLESGKYVLVNESSFIL